VGCPCQRLPLHKFTSLLLHLRDLTQGSHLTHGPMAVNYWELGRHQGVSALRLCPLKAAKSP